MAEGTGFGEAAEQSKRRRRTIVFALLFAAGMVTGAYVGWTVAANDYDFSQPWSPQICLALTLLYLAAMGFGSVALSKLMDEVERLNSYKAASFAGAVYVILYPCWFLLWKGGFVVEPIHWLLFVIFWLSLALAQGYYRLR